MKRLDLAQDSKTALLVIDQQYDFEPGGALEVQEGDQIVKPIAKLMAEFQTVVATQDSHPAGHISFASSYHAKKPFELLKLEEVESPGFEAKNFSKSQIVSYLKTIPNQTQVLWPDHCIPGTKGWELDARLPLEACDIILRKGRRIDCDSYSAFFENDGSPTGLTELLQRRGIKRLVTVGLAGDYCVYWTAKDARKEGFEVVYDPRLTRFVGFPHKPEVSIADLKEKGVVLASLD